MIVVATHDRPARLRTAVQRIADGTLLGSSRSNTDASASAYPADAESAPALG